MAKRPQTLIACPAQKWGQLTNQASFTNFANCLWFHRRPVCLGLFGLSCVFAQIAACGELSHCPLPVSHFPFPMPSWVSHFRAWECHLLPGSGTTRFIWLLQSIVVGFFAPRSPGLVAKKKKIPCFSGLKNLAYCRARRLRVFVRLCVATDFWIFPKQQLF